MMTFPLIPTPFKILALVLALFGTFLYGKHIGNVNCQAKLTQIEAEKEQQKATYEQIIGEKKAEIVTEYVDRWHTVQSRSQRHTSIASNNVPDKNELSNGWVYLHDASATNNEANVEKSSDESSSGVRENQALATVVTNYSRYHQCVAQVESLQRLINEHNKAIDQAVESKK